MESKDISYSSITQSSSDLNCDDGELSISHNIINQNGAMRPVVIPGPEFTLNESEKLLYVHNTPAGKKNYIIQTFLPQDNSTGAHLASRNEEGASTVFYDLKDNQEIYKTESIGNTLIILFNTGIEYFLLKDHEYDALGNRPPELFLSFGLRGQLKESSTTRIDMSNNNSTVFNNAVYFDGATKQQVSDQIKPLINTFISEVTNAGGFVFPFFVRYAYKTYEGAYMQSPPVLLIPNSYRFPFIPITFTSYDNGILKAVDVKVVGYAAGLDYRIYDFDAIVAQLKKWGDVIKSVDIYVSSPIYSYDQSGQCTAASGFIAFNNPFPSIGSGFICCSVNDKGERRYGKVYSGNIGSMEIIGPSVDTDKFYKNIQETSVFRKVKSLNLDDLKSYDVINIESEVMNALNVQETLDDDYNSHDILCPQYSFTYNSRLNIANVRRSPCAFPLESLVTYTNCASGSSGDLQTYRYYLYILIKSNGKEILVKSDNNIPLYEPPKYLFYPNPNATRIIIERIDGSGNKTYAEFPMVEHKFLNGAYYFNNFASEAFKSAFDTSVLENKEDYINESNKIYTSELRNPFFFPLEGINSIGVGEITGISSTTKALSQGQFGQFPLIVFSTDGIWAMEVSSTGLYSAKQPISRDVCSNPASITQIDGSVVFVSEKGAMSIDGSSVQPFSSEMDGPSFDTFRILKLDAILSKEDLSGQLGAIVPFKEYIANCKIAYDYPNQRLMFINDTYRYSYIYSLDSHSWATLSSDFSQVVTDYPRSYLQSRDGKVIDISRKINWDEDKSVKCMLLSRPMKLDGDMLKTVNTVINRGHFLDKSRMAVVLFASTDGIRYFPVGSAIGSQLSRLQGSPYRYFRLLTVATMSPKENLSVSSVYYTPKWRNKPR